MLTQSFLQISPVNNNISKAGGGSFGSSGGTPPPPPAPTHGMGGQTAGDLQTSKSTLKLDSDKLVLV